jgi:hypothetical protein
VEDAAPPASPSTITAPTRPPMNATVPEAQIGSAMPNAAITVTARYEPAVTPRVSGEASALRDSDCSSVPATPSAIPTVTPAARRGILDPHSTVSSAKTAPLVPCVRCHSEARRSRTARTTSAPIALRRAARRTGAASASVGVPRVSASVTCSAPRRTRR